MAITPAAMLSLAQKRRSLRMITCVSGWLLNRSRQSSTPPRRRGGVEDCRLLFSSQPLTHVIMRNDRRFWAKDNIAAGVIAMPMCIQDKLQFLVGNPFERGPDLIGERRKLIVNNQKSVITNRHADISARAFEHVDVAGNFCCLHLNFGKVSLRLRTRSKDTQNRQQEKLLHVISS